MPPALSCFILPISFPHVEYWRWRGLCVYQAVECDLWGFHWSKDAIWGNLNGFLWHRSNSEEKIDAISALYFLRSMPAYRVFLAKYSPGRIANRNWWSRQPDLCWMQILRRGVRIMGQRWLHSHQVSFLFLSVYQTRGYGQNVRLQPQPRACGLHLSAIKNHIYIILHKSHCSSLHF